MDRPHAGSRGSLLVGPQGCSVHPGFSAEVVDTVGAGGAFTVVLAYGLLSGASLDAINEQANRVASFVCSRCGATPEMRELRVVAFLLSMGYPRTSRSPCLCCRTAYPGRPKPSCPINREHFHEPH